MNCHRILIRFCSKLFLMIKLINEISVILSHKGIRAKKRVASLLNKEQNYLSMNNSSMD